MLIEKASVVRSTAGRDTGSLFLVLELLPDNYAYVIDGKTRRIEKPKRKKLKHLAFVRKDESRIREKLLNGERLTNAEIRKYLSALLAELSDRNGV